MATVKERLAAWLESDALWKSTLAMFAKSIVEFASWVVAAYLGLLFLVLVPYITYELPLSPLATETANHVLLIAAPAWYVNYCWATTLGS